MLAAGFIGTSVLHRQRRARLAQSASLTATIVPASSELVVGEALSDTTNWAAFSDPANYATDAEGEAIADVTLNYTGSTANALEPFADGDINVFSVTVTDTAGNTRTFETVARTVLHIPPQLVASLSDQSLQRDTGLQTYDTSGVFSGLDLTFSATLPAGASIGPATGIITFDTDAIPVQSGAPIVVTASNSGGSAQSTFNLDITAPLTVPGQMAAPAVVAESSTLVTAVLAMPPFDGNSPVTEYDLRYRINDGSWIIQQDVSSPVQLSSGITEDDLVAVQTRAQNAIGNGPWSASASVTTPLAPPFAAGALPDRTYDLGAVITPFDVSADFTGTGLSYTLAPSSAGLPTGLSLASNGIISGTPTVETGPVSIVVRATNTSGSADSAFNIVVAENLGISLEGDGQEPVIVATGGTVSVTIGSGVHAGTYAQRVTDGATLTVAMIEAAPTCVKLPVVSGPSGAGDTLSITPGLWLYAGADPGDQSWQQRLGGADVADGTGLSYVVQAADENAVFTVVETFGGLTVESLPFVIGAGPASFDPSDLFTGANAGTEGFWIEPADTSTLWQDTGRVTQADSNGDLVEAIDDKSGNGWQFNRVGANASVFNNTGSEVFLTNGAGDSGFHPVAGPLGAALTDGTVVDVFVGMRMPSSDVTALLFPTVNGSAFVGAIQSGGAGAEATYPDAAYFTDTGSEIIGATRNDLYLAWATNTKLVAIAEGIDTTGITLSGRQPSLFYYPGAGFSLNADIFCIICVERSVAAANRADIISYIQGKF